MEPLALVRFAHFTATLVAAGTVWLALIVPRPAPTVFERRQHVLALAALALAVLSGAAWLALVAADVIGVPLADLRLGEAWPVVTDTRFGQLSAIRLPLALTLALAMAWRGARALQGLLALGLVVLLASTGHAGATPGTVGYAVLGADMAHLVAAGAWLGALPAFALLLGSRPGGRPGDADLVRVTRRFSRLAILAVTALTVSGLINSWHLLSGPRNLLDTVYGRLLALKLVLFAAMLALAAVNRFDLTPALPAARTALARNALIETVLGLGVLALVAVLGTIAPGGHVHHDVDLSAEASFVHIHAAGAMADVTINPGRVGRVDISIRLAQEDMSELSVRAVTVAFNPPQNGARLTSEHAAVRDAHDVWEIKGVDCTQDGVWTMRLTITPHSGSSIVLDAPVVIAR